MAGKFDLAAKLADGMELAEQRPIEVITAEIQVLKAQVGVGIVEIGNRLLEAKAQLDHGEWLPWLEEQVQFSVSQANRFMRLAKEYSNSSPVTNLGVRKALALLAFEPEEREAFVAEGHVVNGEEKTVENMSVRELDQAIRERKEAMEAKERAEAEAKAAEEARAKMAADMTLATARIESLSETEAHLDGVIASLKKELEELRQQPIEVTGTAVPDEAALAAARKEGADEAGKAARKAAEEKLKGKLEKAEKAKADAEAQVQAVKAEQAAALAKADALEKQLKLVTNPAATEFRVHFDGTQEKIDEMLACLDRVKTSDPDLHEKLTTALVALGEKICERANMHLSGEEGQS